MKMNAIDVMRPFVKFCCCHSGIHASCRLPVFSPQRMWFMSDHDTGVSGPQRDGFSRRTFIKQTIAAGATEGIVGAVPESVQRK